MLEMINNIVFSNDNKDFGYIGTDIVTFFSDGVEINTIDLTDINLDDYLGIMIHARLVGLRNEYKRRKTFKKT